MPTTKQLAANRANAARSIGPRTPLGKTRSSRNARKHSFAGTDFAIVKMARTGVSPLCASRKDRFEAGLFTTALNEALLIPSDETPFVPLHDSLALDPEEIKARTATIASPTASTT